MLLKSYIYILVTLLFLLKTKKENNTTLKILSYKIFTKNS